LFGHRLELLLARPTEGSEGFETMHVRSLPLKLRGQPTPERPHGADYCPSPLPAFPYTEHVGTKALLTLVVIAPSGPYQ
jgi:hypothetical protein